MARRNAIVDGLNALSAAAKAIHGLRAPAREVARQNTLRSIWAELRVCRNQFQHIEESFRGISDFASKTTEFIGGLSARIADIEARIEMLETKRLGEGTKEPGE